MANVFPITALVPDDDPSYCCPCNQVVNACACDNDFYFWYVEARVTTVIGGVTTVCNFGDGCVLGQTYIDNFTSDTTLTEFRFQYAYPLPYTSLVFYWTIRATDTSTTFPYSYTDTNHNSVINPTLTDIYPVGSLTAYIVYEVLTMSAVLS